MSCRLAAVLQVAGRDGVAFDPFSFQQDDLAASEVDVGRWRMVRPCWSDWRPVLPVALDAEIKDTGDKLARYDRAIE